MTPSYNNPRVSFCQASSFPSYFILEFWTYPAHCILRNSITINGEEYKLSLMFEAWREDEGGGGWGGGIGSSRKKWGYWDTTFTTEKPKSLPLWRFPPVLLVKIRGKWRLGKALGSEGGKWYVVGCLSMSRGKRLISHWTTSQCSWWQQKDPTTSMQCNVEFEY